MATNKTNRAKTRRPAATAANREAGEAGLPAGAPLPSAEPPQRSADEATRAAALAGPSPTPRPARTQQPALRRSSALANGAAPIPTLAIMGHPNAGKSSVVATLTENDRIAIDKRAGTTLTSDAHPVVIDGREVMVFIDTPGFQNPSVILEWFQAHADERDLAGAFVATHADDPEFSHDCALLQPVAAGAGIVLVVDGSKRIKEKDRIEMELLRLTARPRMAILNNLSDQATHMPAWQDALNKSFNAVREFNAHRATYAERIALLSALKTIDQRWEPMLRATIEAFERDWQRRIEQTVGSIIILLRDALSYRVSKVMRADELASEADREVVRGVLVDAFQDGLRQLEGRAQDEIRDHFKHNVWHLPPDSLLRKDLFSEEVEQHLGLRRHQLIIAGIGAGAATGLLLDVAVGGMSLGLATAIGAAGGGVLGVLGGAALAKIDIQRTLGVERFSMGPVTNPRFPFILLDRIILYCARAMNWSHGRQAANEDSPHKVPERQPSKHRGFTEALSSDDHKALAKFFIAARKGRDCKDESRVREIIERILRGLSVDEIDSRIDL